MLMLQYDDSLYFDGYLQIDAELHVATDLLFDFFDADLQLS